jgi:hypothetical protein
MDNKQYQNGLSQRRSAFTSVTAKDRGEAAVDAGAFLVDCEDPERLNHLGGEITTRRRKEPRQRLLCRGKLASAVLSLRRILLKISLLRTTGLQKRFKKNNGWRYSVVSAITVGLFLVACLPRRLDYRISCGSLWRAIMSSASTETRKSPYYDPLLRVSFSSLLPFPYRQQKQPSSRPFPTWLNTPDPPEVSFKLMGRKSSYGGLVLMMLENAAGGRVMFHDLSEDERVDIINLRRNASSNDDNVDFYYNFDDDALRNPARVNNDDTVAGTRRCRRTAWHRNIPLNCNMFHELGVAYDSTRSKSVEDLELTYLGYVVLHSPSETRCLLTAWLLFLIERREGSYRQVFSINTPSMDSIPKLALKVHLAGEEAADMQGYEFIRVEAVVAERLSGKRRISDVYGTTRAGLCSYLIRDVIFT